MMHAARPSSFVRAGSWLLVASLVPLAVGCNRERILVSSLPSEDPPRRAAESFVHCVEASTSGCVSPGDNHGGWDALHLLLWMASGSPLGLIEALPQQLVRHQDPRLVRDAFVDEVERYAEVMRGSECESTSSQPMSPVIDEAATRASARLRRLGMWRSGFGTVIEGLQKEAHDQLDSGHLVRLDCGYDPYRVYLATHDRDGRIVVVGMTTVLDAAFGGDSPSRDDVDVRLGSRPLGLGTAQAPIIDGAVDPWLPFPLEEL
ncbi:MAG: hypothetical protein IAG13_10335 [Deltaproteobacteria bacterium]|nr:hypothetical protein [Nannocystaceae bacterium]